ncbi:hypothetical protein NC651_017605 [Populus alba x Populus x berolinensis]|nr:hypothetical protein NC651_017605 [Populus alba x Populus x berolinensis]
MMLELVLSDMLLVEIAMMSRIGSFLRAYKY